MGNGILRLRGIQCWGRDQRERERKRGKERERERERLRRGGKKKVCRVREREAMTLNELRIGQVSYTFL